MNQGLLLDTDILVDFLRGEPKAVDYLKGNSHRVNLSAISVAELYAGVRGQTERERLDSFVSVFPVLSVTEDVAAEGGLLKGKHSKAAGTGLADALIASTALLNGLQLETLNAKHCPMFPGLKPPYRK